MTGLRGTLSVSLLNKFDLFYLIVLITLVFLILTLMALSLMKSHILNAGIVIFSKLGWVFFIVSVTKIVIRSLLSK